MKWRIAAVSLGMFGMHLVPAHAGLVEFSLNGQVALAAGALADVAQGSAFRGTFVLDTAQFAADELRFATFSNPNFTTTEPVVDSFALSGSGFHDVSVNIGNHAFSAAVGQGSYDGLLSSPINGDDYDMSMSFLTSTFGLSLRDFNTTNRGGFGVSELGTDPFGFLALGFDRIPAFTSFSGDFGNYAVAVDSLLVRSVSSSVPEPATALLFAVALGFMGLAKRSVSQKRAALA